MRRSYYIHARLGGRSGRMWGARRGTHGDRHGNAFQCTRLYIEALSLRLLRLRRTGSHGTRGSCARSVEPASRWRSSSPSSRGPSSRFLSPFLPFVRVLPESGTCWGYERAVARNKGSLSLSLSRFRRDSVSSDRRADFLGLLLVRHARGHPRV